MTSLKVLGFTLTDRLSVTVHVDDVVSSCARSMYAISVLRSHGMESSALQQVFCAVVVSKLTYAAPAWWGFTTSVDPQRLNAILRRAARSDLWTSAAKSESDAHMFEDLCNLADEELFTKIRTLSNHSFIHSSGAAVGHLQSFDVPFSLPPVRNSRLTLGLVLYVYRA